MSSTRGTSGTSSIVNMREFVEIKLPNLQKHHLQFLREQAPKMVLAIKHGRTRAYLGSLYLQYVKTFPEQRLTLSTKDLLQKFKELEAHIYLLGSAILETVEDKVLEKEKVTWDQIVTYICAYRGAEVIVTWDTMKAWLEECHTSEFQIWN